MTLARSQLTTVPFSSLIAFPQPISMVAFTTPGRSISDRLARVIVVVPLEPTENGKNFDSLTLMMSSKRSVALTGVDEGDVGVSSPQPAQNDITTARRAARRMSQSILSDARQGGVGWYGEPRVEGRYGLEGSKLILRGPD